MPTITKIHVASAPQPTIEELRLRRLRQFNLSTSTARIIAAMVFGDCPEPWALSSSQTASQGACHE